MEVDHCEKTLVSVEEVVMGVGVLSVVLETAKAVILV